VNNRRLPAGLGRKCIVVASLGDVARLSTDARRAVKEGAGMIEVRADLFPKSQLKPEPLRRALSDLRKSVRCRLLLTLRMGEEGGGLSPKFREQDRLALFRVGLSEADGVDVELAAGDINRHVLFEAHKRGRFVVLSAHDFKKTPSRAALAAMVRKARRLKGDILKVAARPSNRADVERLMDFCAKAAFKRRVFIPLGSLGKEIRAGGGWACGSCLTYGYVRRPLAPGQLPVNRLAAALKARAPA
jgi:3-dehydroquinate dehydratase-1